MAIEETNEGLNISKVPLILEFLWCQIFVCLVLNSDNESGLLEGERAVLSLQCSDFYYLFLLAASDMSSHREQSDMQGRDTDYSAVGGGGRVRPHMGRRTGSMNSQESEHQVSKCQERLLLSNDATI